MPEVLLFAGPTTWGLNAEAFVGASVRVLPPARRDDVTRLTGNRPPGVLILCDGTFESTPAVSHRELCMAIEAGWQVWGVSSLGAIRAYELRNEGMHGFGEVHAMFECIEDFADDELCLLHCPEPPYFAVTEPLVNVRHALARLGPALGLTQVAAQTVIRALRGLWFGDRTHDRIHAALVQEGGLSSTCAGLVMAWLQSNRLKTLDLAQMLATRPWLGSP